MKKIKEIEYLVYSDNIINITRIDNKLHLYNDSNSICYNDIFDIIYYGLLHQIQDINFWNITISEQDLNDAQPVNLIYYLSGGSKIWNNNNMYTKNWLEMSDIFLNYLESKILKILKKTSLGKLKNKIIKHLSMEDCYEIAIKLNLLQHNDTNL